MPSIATDWPVAEAVVWAKSGRSDGVDVSVDTDASSRSIAAAVLRIGAFTICLWEVQGTQSSKISIYYQTDAALQ